EARLVGIRGAVIEAGDLAVGAARARAGLPAARRRAAHRAVDAGVAGAAVIARQLAIAVLVAVEGRRDAGKIADHVLDLRLRDHLLALENAPEQQADDDQHDGDLNQRESFLYLLHLFP